MRRLKKRELPNRHLSFPMIAGGWLWAALGTATLALPALGQAGETKATSTSSASSTSKTAQPQEKSDEDDLFVETPPPEGPTPRTADGHPDFSGFWKGTRATKPVGNIGKDLPGFKLPLTSEGEAALQRNLTQTIDPESRCLIGGIPRHDASALPFAIVQNKDHVTFLYMYTYYRTIPFDVHKHVQDRDPRYFGDEIGWWEGDTFVIDTIGLKDHDMWIDENGNPQSGAMHATERWTRPDAGHIHVEVRIDDPRFYTHPFTYSRTWTGTKSFTDLPEALCTENNADLRHLGPGPGGIRPDGTRGYNVPPLPDNPPPPPDSYDAKRDQH